MSGEGRRSGRANAGVHSKLRESESAQATPPPTSKKISKGKGKKSQQLEEPEEEEDIIRCVCGEYDEDADVPMIACEKCDAWQHNACVGFPLDEKDIEKFGKNYKYYCEQCDLGSHEELLAAIEDGLKPWTGKSWIRQDMVKKATTAKSKGGRNTLPARTKRPQAKEKTKTPTPAPQAAASGAQEKSKRKQSVEDDVPEQPSKLRKPSAQDKASADVPSSSRKVSVPASSKKAKQEPVKKEEVASSIDDLQNPQRKKIAAHLKDKFLSQIKALNTAGDFRIPDIHNSNSLAETTAIDVEQALFTAYCNVPKPDYSGKYSDQMKVISANMPKNNELMLRLLNAETSPDQLVRMESEDMASQERQIADAKAKAQAAKQSTLVTEANGRPHVRRTHKGDEVIEDPNSGTASEALPPPPSVPRRDSEMLPPHSPTTGQDTIMTEDGAPSLDRRSSSNFDIKNVWQSVQATERPSSGYTPQSAQRDRVSAPKLEQDAGIDRLLEDDEDDQAPYSPREYEGPPVAWSGHVDMPNIGRFKAHAIHVAGADLSPRISVADIFPDSLTMSGRIHGAKADEYLSTLGSARNTDVVVFNILSDHTSPIPDGKKQFDKLWDYFVKRDRWGVVSDQMHREHVTDTYVVPLEQGMNSPPSFLTRLAHNEIEAPRPKDMLLAVFVIKWRNQQSQSQSNMSSTQGTILSPGGSVPPLTSATPLGPGGTAMSPIATPASTQQHGLGFPLPQHQSSSLPSHGQQGGFPENPYGAPAPSINGQSAAHAILGDYYHCPTAQQIMASQAADGSQVEEFLLNNMRKIFDQYPEARSDMSRFAEILQMEQGQQR